MSLHLKRLMAVALAVTVSASFIAICKAGGPGKRAPMDPRGEPEGLKKGVTECYKVWHNDEGWHVRAVNAKGSRDHRYQGTITVENGVIEEMHSHLAKKNGAEAQWKHGAKKNEISWDFATPEKEDGINFKASKGASRITFKLTIDGKEVPEQVYVGKLCSHPESSSFTVAAHPGENNPEKRISAGPQKTGKK